MADLTITAANVKPLDNTGQIQLVKVGEAVTQGEVLYQDQNNGKYYLALASGGSDEAEAKGIALTPAALDGFTVLQTQGKIDLGATLAQGITYVVSAAEGAIAPQNDLSSEFLTILGYADSTSSLTMDINATGILA